MIRFKNLLAAGTFTAVASIAFAAPASAQVARTWVASAGDDLSATCTRALPCKTFASAITKTNAGGEINCVDASGYGPVTITKAISITCDSLEAGILVSGIPAISINAGNNDTVILSGLDINGSVSGPNGIQINTGGSVIIRNTKVESFTAVGASGIAFRSTGSTKLTLTNVTLVNNYHGLSVAPVGTGSGYVSLSNSVIAGNSATGVRAVANGGSARLTIDGTTVVQNGTGIVADATANNGAAGITVTDSDVSSNSWAGMMATGANSGITVGSSTVSGNSVGVQASGSGVLKSYGDNHFEANTTDGTFSAAIALR